LIEAAESSGGRSSTPTQQDAADSCWQLQMVLIAAAAAYKA
jgi:hypothetical protein